MMTTTTATLSDAPAAAAAAELVAAGVLLDEDDVLAAPHTLQGAPGAVDAGADDDHVRHPATLQERSARHAVRVTVRSSARSAVRGRQRLNERAGRARVRACPWWTRAQCEEGDVCKCKQKQEEGETFSPLALWLAVNLAVCFSEWDASGQPRSTPAQAMRETKESVRIPQGCEARVEKRRVKGMRKTCRTSPESSTERWRTSTHESECSAASCWRARHRSALG